MDLFEGAKAPFEPLASRMRPRTIEEFIGQDHILGPGRLLRRAIAADQLSSLIFYGPPGTGKTTLAQVIAHRTKSHFLALNAVLSGVKDIREIIEKALDMRRLRGNRTILFVDEVHRWNKAQQDALLPWVENGTFILIGATTENPYFEVNSALVSRSRLFQLKPLENHDLMKAAQAAILDKDRGYGRFKVTFEPGALEHLVNTAAGDARSLLNALELAVETSVTPFPPQDGTAIPVTMETAEESIQRKVVLYDKDGDYHYDTVSAFIKSLRGSDPDGALYWLARMVRSGEDPHFIFRRMLISASEDVGLADPGALSVVIAASEAFHKVGMPEGQYHLAQAALYLAAAPKSNSTMGYFEALKTLEIEQAGSVPSYLKDPSRDGKAFGHGQGYQYPHAFKDHWVAQQYLPKNLAKKIFYKPGALGWEGDRRDEILSRRETVLALELSDADQEVYSFSDLDGGWQRRLESAGAQNLDKARSTFIDSLKWERHQRVLVARDNQGLLLFEALRRCPEGGVWTCVPDQGQRRTLEDYLNFLPDLQKPEFIPFPFELIPPGQGPEDGTIDRILSISPWTEAQDPSLFFQSLPRLLAPSGQAGLIQILPHESQRLSDLLPPGALGHQELDDLKKAEMEFLKEKGAAGVDWDGVKALGSEQGIVIAFDRIETSGPAVLNQGLLDKWLSSSRPGGLGAWIVQRWGPSQWEKTAKTVSLYLGGKEVSWKKVYGLLIWQKH